VIKVVFYSRIIRLVHIIIPADVLLPPVNIALCAWDILNLQFIGEAVAA
jgi:hypothetical protein